MAEYRLTPAAERDLEDIWRYTRERWGMEQAIRYTDDLTDAFTSLAQAPSLARPCDDIRLGYRRRRVGQHVIYLAEAAYGIRIVRVLHVRMEATLHLRKPDSIE